MKILVVCGSPHKNGTTNALADAFISGVDEKQHIVEKIQIADKKICIGFSTVLFWIHCTA